MAIDKLKIAFLTADDPCDLRAFSGTYNYMLEALMRNGFDVTVIGPLKKWEEKIKSGRQTVAKVAKPVLSKKTDYLFSYLVSMQYASRAQKKLKGKNFDFIFAPNAFKEIAFLKTKVPIVYTNDCIWRQLVNYYDRFSNLTDVAIWLVNRLEKKAIQKSAIHSYPMEWAANAVKEQYGIEDSKITINPWGANITTTPNRELVLSRKKSNECRLLFLGRRWERKGGDIALETLIELEKLGINAHLTVCGCPVPENISHPRMKVIRFLDKKDPVQKKQFEDLFLTSDFFILPTRADCVGMVFNEAAAYGLPCIGTKTGGISDVVKEGVNGYVLPLEARGDAYAKIIKEIYTDDTRYNKLVRSNRDRYEECMNWDSWAEKLHITLSDYQLKHPH